MFELLAEFGTTFIQLLLMMFLDIVKPLLPIFIVALAARFAVYWIGVILRLIRNFSKGDDYEF